MKIKALIADTTRHVVKKVASRGKEEFIKAGKSTYRQVVYGKNAPPPAPVEKMHKTYNQLSAKGETKKFGLSLMTQVSGKKFSYQELQELQAANEGTESTAHAQLRAKINQIYHAHAQRTAQKNAAEQKQAEEVKEQGQGEIGQGDDQKAPVRRDIAKTRTEIGRNFGAE